MGDIVLARGLSINEETIPRISKRAITVFDGKDEMLSPAKNFPQKRKGNSILVCQTRQLNTERLSMRDLSLVHTSSCGQ